MLYAMTGTSHKFARLHTLQILFKSESSRFVTTLLNKCPKLRNLSINRAYSSVCYGCFIGVHCPSVTSRQLTGELDDEIFWGLAACFPNLLSFEFDSSAECATSIVGVCWPTQI